MYRFLSYNCLFHDINTSSFISGLNHNVIITFKVMETPTLARRKVIMQFDGCGVQVMNEDN